MDHFSMREYFQDSNSGGTSLDEAYSKDNSFLANTLRMVKKKKKEKESEDNANEGAANEGGAKGGAAKGGAAKGGAAKGGAAKGGAAKGGAGEGAVNVWNYLGLNNINKKQRECLFNCSCSGMTCLGNCNNDKCKYKCGCNSIDCLKKCMEPVKRKKVVKKIEAVAEEEEEEELRKNNTLENIPLHGNVINNFARFTPIEGDSYSVFVEPGIFSEKSPETIKIDASRNRELENYKLKLRY
jgi:hypothetical protein